MAQRYDSTADFSAFHRIRDNLQEEMSRGFNQAAARMRDIDFKDRSAEAGSFAGDVLGKEVTKSLDALGGLFESLADVFETQSQPSRDAETEQPLHAQPANQNVSPKDTQHAYRAKNFGNDNTGDMPNTARHSGNAAAFAFEPALHRTENHEFYWLIFALVGVDPDTIDLQLSHDSLTLSGSQPIFSDSKTQSTRSHENNNETFTKGDGKQGFSKLSKQQSFKRTVTIPVDADCTSIEADCKNGMLVIAIRKKSVETSRKIKLNSAS